MYASFQTEDDEHEHTHLVHKEIIQRLEDDSL